MFMHRFRIIVIVLSMPLVFCVSHLKMMYLPLLEFQEELLRKELPKSSRERHTFPVRWNTEANGSRWVFPGARSRQRNPCRVSEDVLCPTIPFCFPTPTRQLEGWSPYFSSVPHSSHPPDLSRTVTVSSSLWFRIMIDCLAPRILLWSKGEVSISTQPHSQKNPPPIFFPFPLFSDFLNRPLPHGFMSWAWGIEGVWDEADKLSVQQRWPPPQS